METEWKVAKDDRNKAKHSKQRFYKKKGSQVSASPEPPQSVIDVADSSDDSYYKRAKSSNWARYEEDTDVDFTENEQMTAADFEFLQEHPSHSGAHFTFSSEKEWENDTETSKTMNISYFNLNLALLNAGLQTIPFYKRMDYGKSLFPKYKIKEMDEQAEKAEIIYKALLKDAEDDIMKKMQEDNGRKTSAKSVKDKSSKPTSPENASRPTEPPADVQEGKDDELDKLLSMTENDVSQLTIEEKTSEIKEVETIKSGEITETLTVQNEGNGQEPESGNKENIQEWLDGILDD